LGNRKTLQSCGGFTRDKRLRASEDLYTTDQGSFERFLFALRRDGVGIGDYVLEPAAGLGDLSYILESRCKEVYSYDKTLYEKALVLKSPIQQGDFLDYNFSQYFDRLQTIITNPPFMLAPEFISRAHSVLKMCSSRDRKIMLLLRLSFLEGQKREKLFTMYPMSYVYVYRSRALAYSGGVRTKGASAAICFAWFIWEVDKLSRAEPVIRWID